jgi:hypothetical protein
VWDFLTNSIDALLKPVLEDISRNETVIRLLKNFNLDPDHPPPMLPGFTNTPPADHEGLATDMAWSAALPYC